MDTVDVPPMNWSSPVHTPRAASSVPFHRTRGMGADPCTTPRKRCRDFTYGDRFVAHRSGRNLLAEFHLARESPALKRLRLDLSHQDEDQRAAHQKYQAVLQQELLGGVVLPSDAPTNLLRSDGTTPRTPSTPRIRTWRSSPTTPRMPRVTPYNSSGHQVYTQSPLSVRSQRMLTFNEEGIRRIADKRPYKVLDAPNMVDDFYLHLLDWSSTNIVAVALAEDIYLWSAQTEQVDFLGRQGTPPGVVTGLAWNSDGKHLATAIHRGRVSLWDGETLQNVQQVDCHRDRVGVITFGDPHVFFTGSRDTIVKAFDIRAGPRSVRRYTAHGQEVCGLAFNPLTQQLASGGNENCVMVWDHRQAQRPLWKWDHHSAAVRALAWSPHERHLLASGGGTADKTIRTWNTRIGRSLHTVDTGSQVCNLVWSTTSPELVTTHGYSQHHIALWHYPTFKRLATFTGHRARVLNCALAPDGQNLATATADETLRFWKVFPCKPNSGTAQLTRYA
ncbi:substrate-specific activator of APC-dependent proteolysis [Dispira simplex]|nr:substrate-specific activator of APC-dependent proteolysis [Dispira simplex]